MPTVKTLIGNVKGPQGDKGDTGATGEAGVAATIEVGRTTTVSATSPAKVTNVGTPNAAVLNFEIPKGEQGNIGEISGYAVNAITTQPGDFPMPVVGDTIASIVGKQAKATADAQTGIQTINTNIANILGDFAMVEAGTTASKPYEVGERLVLNGLYYKVTAAISQGNQLVVDGNIEKTTVGDDITSLKNDLAKRTIWTNVGVIEQLSGENQTINLPQSYSELLIQLRYYNGIIASLVIPNGTYPRNIMGKVETLATVVCYCGINSGRLIIKISEGTSIGMSCEVLAKLA